MKFPLRLKFTAAFFVIFISGFTCLATFGTALIRKQAENDVLNDLYKKANYIAASYKVNTGALSQRELETMAYAAGADIWVLDIDGTVSAWAGTDTPPDEFTKFNPAAGSEGYYMTGDFYGTFPEEMLSVYAPLTLSITAQGYVILHYPVSAITKSADRQSAVAYITFAFMLVFILLLFIFLEFSVVQPAKKLKNAGHEYASGNLNFPQAVSSHDEFGSISVTQADLAKQLQSSSDDQHRFLANISHDFRSPLTSIRGYMVAIQDGTIPPELQGKYIDVVINETDRLTKLANGLLDMTQLENGIILDRSLFDINDLFRSILPTFEGRAAEKDLSFEVIFEEEHRPVFADRARIQQVIHNLVDNAIKFSGNGSSIDIATQLHGDKVFVSVKDHGVGIAKENLNKIWERFYKTDTSRGKDKKGTGLGLSIVREIIQAHRENIDVISTPDVGTEFIFTLPAYASSKKTERSRTEQ